MDDYVVLELIFFEKLIIHNSRCQEPACTSVTVNVFVPALVPRAAAPDMGVSPRWATLIPTGACGTTRDNTELHN